MHRRWKPSQFSSLNSRVEVEIDVKSDVDEESPQPPSKRRRGRPKATPASLEFDVERAGLAVHSHIKALLDGNVVRPESTGRISRVLSPTTCNNTVTAEDPADTPPYDSGHGTGQQPKNTRKTPNDNLREWLDTYTDDYLQGWYSFDTGPTSSICLSCSHEANVFHRCVTCVGQGIVCSKCLVQTHQHNPTHRIRTWDGSSWEDDNLSRSDLGYCLFLGHGSKQCRSNNNSWNLLVGDLNGFVLIDVRYCTCEGHLPRTRQLLQAGLFPCSHRRPESAVTFSLLEMYDLLTTVGRTSGHKYYSVLSRFTRPGFPSDVDDRYRELMWTHRRYNLLSQLRRSGKLFLTHPILDVHQGDQAVDCVACPRPGLNFEWHEVSESERAYFRIWISYDGNARNVRKDKKVDWNDVCLSDDKAYFAEKDAYKKWTESVPQPRRTEKPDCDNHKAGNVTSARWVGRDVTGVGMFSCTSHSCILPRGAVDFYKGERFAYADHALGSLITYMLERRNDPLLIGITYDVWCHYITNFYERIKLLPPSIQIPESLDLIGAIPKWHLIGHERNCYVRYSLDNTPHVGRLEGEGVERFWSHLNQLSGSTSEQGPGFRTDSVNNIIRRWNDDKNYSAHETVPHRYDEARKMLSKTRSDYQSLTSTLPADKVASWERESTRPVKGPDGKQWLSPMMDPVLERGGFQETARLQRKKEDPAARAAGRRPGTVRWISDGIELEHNIRNYNDEAKHLGSSPALKRADALNAKRLGLRNRIQDFLKRREYHMRDLPEPNSPRPFPLYEEDDDEHEGVDLGMPSSYSKDTICSTNDLDSLAKVELELRRAVCNEALEAVKRMLGVKAQAVRKKRQAGSERGNNATTRAEAAIQTEHARLVKARWRYSNSYQAMAQLGISDCDSDCYQEISDADLVPLKAYFVNYAENVGHGATTMSWIWRSSAVPNVDEWEVQALRTEWFRSRERYKRWEEQLVLMKREMVMTIRSFLRFKELWEWRAQHAGNTGGMSAYASGRGKFYSKLASQMFESCRLQLYDDTVELKWCSDWLREHVLGKYKISLCLAFF